MVKVDLNELAESGHSRYGFVVAIAKRAREITDQQLEQEKDLTELERSRNAMIEKPKNGRTEENPEKSIRLAVEEYLGGKLDFVEKK